MVAAALALLVAQTTWAGAPIPDVISLSSQDCSWADDIPREAVCLRAIVPEDYAKPEARTIGLDLVILKATGHGAHGAPLFIFQGGPGDRTTSSARDESRIWTKFRIAHDLVFIDQRGNGETPALGCAAEMAKSTSRATDLFPAGPLADCARRLARSVDLARYTTTDAARDVDNVRNALGYGQINIVGYSYGTRLAQEVLRRNDAAVRAALLIGPEAPTMSVPAGMAVVAQQSLVSIIDRCKAEVHCASSWPMLDSDLERLQQRLKRGTFELTTWAGLRKTTISAGVVASYLRMQLYSAGSAAAIPRLVHALADQQHDRAELRKIAEWHEGFMTWLPLGMYMAVTCAEDLPFVDVDAEHRAAEDTFLGSYRVDQQAAACAAWPRVQPNVAVHEPVRTAVPALLLVGEFDPATPPRLIPDILAGFAHGRAIVVPNRGHSMPEGWDACLGGISTSFLEAADNSRLDTGCVARLRMPPFQGSHPPMG